MKSGGGENLTRVVMLNSSAEIVWNAFQGKDFEQPSVMDLLINKYNIEIRQVATDAEEWASSMLKDGLFVL